MKTPAQQRVDRKLSGLVRDNLVTFTGGFTTESYIVHQLISPARYETTVRFHDQKESGPTDWYYVRVRQDNGHMAWSSPFWVGYNA